MYARAAGLAGFVAGAIALAVVATPARPASADSTAKTPADAPVIKIVPTVGDSLSPSEAAAVKKTLDDYLRALQKKDYARAGSVIDRASFLAQAENMVRLTVIDSTKDDARVRRQIFGAGTRDSLAAMPTSALFTAFMNYLNATNPEANAAVANATIQILAVRMIDGIAHVAYQLTLPPTKLRPDPYTQVTVQNMQKVDGKWWILVTD
jgi:hypothetical protein